VIESQWGESENNRRAKFYRLTTAGRARLRAERKQWERLSTGIAAVMNATGLPAEG